MTQSENVSDIIDIDPEMVIENEAIVPPPLPTKSPRKYGIYGLGALVLLASAAMGGWFYKDVLSAYFPSNQIQSLSMRIDFLEASNKAAGAKLDAIVVFTDEIKAQLGAAQAAATEAQKLATAAKTETASGNSKLVAVEGAIAEVAARIDDLKNKFAATPPGRIPADSSGLAARVDKLEESVSSVQQNATATKANVAQLSQALSDLKLKVVSGASYTDEIHRLNQMVPAADGLDILTSNAKTGVATQQQLVERLRSIAAELTPKLEIAPATQDNGWWEKATSIMSGLVTVKTADAIDWQQLAAQCLGLIEQGQIGDSLKLLEQNLESLPKPLQDWRIMAAKRLSVDQALEQVGRAVSREIAARG